MTFRYPSDFDAEPVLKNVNLTIAADDFLGLIGPNGGGKTTLLKVILGLLKPQQGSVRVLGKPPKRSRHKLGYVPQYSQIDPSVPANVLDVVLTGRVGCSSWGPWYGKSDKDWAYEALKQTETLDLAHRPIGALSGGQRQRVLIARALAGDAQLLLLDEPTAGVDVHMTQGLTDLLHNLNERLPIVIVSHDIAFVSSHLKNVACLNRTLDCHPAHEISDETIGHMYHSDHMRVVHHDHCPVADPGCDHGCDEEESKPMEESP